ncbi:OPT/YSL family transporter [bacterium]|nr:OPT/YSL family transporter [bacterium]
MRMREIEELAEYRSLMEAPETYKDGFGWKTVLGALFIGFVMMPGSIYLGLMVGQTMGPAAEWTTIILFTEIARRSFTVLSKQEVYLLYYVAGGLAAGGGTLGLSGGPFAGLVWNQFLRSPSVAPAGLGEQVPNWVAPPSTSEAVLRRTFMHPDWIPAILVLIATMVFSRFAWFTFGYVLFRLTSDGEKLPFPMAPVAAQGATALAEASSKEETWRWRIFSIGSMIGVAFGLLYIGIPTLSGVVLLQPIQILPIPFVDFTQGTERILPGAAIGIGTNISTIFGGFVLPFWMVVGTFAAMVATMIVNPIAAATGHLPTWRPGMESMRTIWAGSIDIWLSFGIGTAFAVAALGIIKMVAGWRAASAEGRKMGFGFGTPPPGRGDFSVIWCMVIFFLCTTGYVILTRYLVPDFPIYFVLFFGYIWTPFESYINARMVGLTSQAVAIPMLRQATFIFSGYKGIKVWFAPIPLSNYGGTAQSFRSVELTGTKFTSLVKAEVLMFPILLVCSFIFWSYIWRLNPIPSVYYPYTQKFWDYEAMNSWLWMTSTTEGPAREMFLRAIKPSLMVGGLGFGLIAYYLLSWLNVPVLTIYGFIRGLGTIPHYIIPEFAGALIGRYYLRKRFGEDNWKRWPPVLLAGLSCGMGLIGMLTIAVSLLKSSITEMPF